MANNYNQENILVGAADIYISLGGKQEHPTLVPNVTARKSYEADENKDKWKHVGLTQGGVELAYAPDFGEVEVDQWLDVAKMFKQRQSVTVNTTFVESTLDNLLFAWGQPARTLNPDTEEEGTYVEGEENIVEISSGELGDAPEERSLGFVGQAPGTGRERVYQLDRVLSVESTTVALSRSEASTIPVALRCLPADASGGAYGRIVERSFTPGAELPDP